MKFFVTFNDAAGQYAGTHWFHSNKFRQSFLRRAAERGIDIKNVFLGKI
jgi:hypothetical protein